MLPSNMSVWCNYGDGLWRAGRNIAEYKLWTQENVITPQPTKAQAILKAEEWWDKNKHTHTVYSRQAG